MFFKKEKIKDGKYLKAHKDFTCIASRNGIDVCGQPSVAAHIRIGEVAGMGTKPGDDLTVPLCDECHRLQHSEGEEWFWIERVFKPQRRRSYREWKLRN